MNATIIGLKGKKINYQSPLSIPSSKSHTIRALIIAFLANGESHILNPLDSKDTRSCVNACKALGAEVILNSKEWIVRGKGGKFKKGDISINVGNSGTSLYLATGLAALSSSTTQFTGDDQIQSRPVLPLLNALRDIGAIINVGSSGCAPFSIKGPVIGGKTTIECLSSQYLSSLLISLPIAKNETVIDVPVLMEKPYVQMTLSWLDEQGIVYKNDDFKKFVIYGKQSYKPFKKNIPGDFSSAAFPFCMAAITGSKLCVSGLSIDDSQGDKAIIDYLTTMGCFFEFSDKGITIIAPGHEDCPNKELVAGDFDLNKTPDALPVMAVTALFSKGSTRLYNVPQARLKETDRISVMFQELSKLGADIRETPDGLIIAGGRPLKAGSLNGHKDHRVVMALACSAIAIEGRTIISDAEAVNITYPGFFQMLEKITKP